AIQPKNVKNDKPSEPTYIHYTPGQQDKAYNSGATQRIIRIVEIPNTKEYTISLDKRLAADERRLQEITINDNFQNYLKHFSQLIDMLVKKYDNMLETCLERKRREEKALAHASTKSLRK
ncbi:26448_t:CDS:2, partial [Gigaspora margarita]